MLVGHVLGRRERAVGGGDSRVRRPVPELLPGVAQVDTVRVRERGAVVIGIPVRERGDEADGVEALPLPVRHGLLEADAGGRDVVRRRLDAPTRQPPRRGREPRVADQEEGRAVRVLQGVPVRRGPDEAPAVGVLPLLVLGPRHRTEPAAAAVQSGVVRLTRARPPAPLARRRRHEPDLERASAVPEAVHAAGEARSLELDPALHVRVGVGVALRRLEGDLLRLPDVDFAGRQRGPGRRRRNRGRRRRAPRSGRREKSWRRPERGGA